MGFTSLTMIVDCCTVLCGAPATSKGCGIDQTDIATPT